MEREQTIGFKVRQLSNVLRKHGEQCGRRLEKQNISMMQSWVIRFLADHREQDIYQKDLERELNIGKSTLTEMLHVMEKNELVQRISSKKDARCKKLVLTDKSEAIHKEVLDDIEAWEQQLRQGISKEQLQQFFETINQMIHNAGAAHE